MQSNTIAQQRECNLRLIESRKSKTVFKPGLTPIKRNSWPVITPKPDTQVFRYTGVVKRTEKASLFTINNRLYWIPKKISKEGVDTSGHKFMVSVPAWFKMQETIQSSLRY